MSSSICFHLPSHHNRHLPPAIKKLHRLLTVTRYRSPFGLGVGILLQATQFVIFEPEVNLFQPRSRRFSNQIFLLAKPDVFCTVDEGLTPLVLSRRLLVISENKDVKGATPAGTAPCKITRRERSY